jgi:hypothetical protein
MSGKQVKLVDDFFVLQGGETSTDCAGQLKIVARLYGMLGRGEIAVHVIAAIASSGLGSKVKWSTCLANPAVRPLQRSASAEVPAACGWRPTTVCGDPVSVMRSPCCRRVLGERDKEAQAWAETLREQLRLKRSARSETTIKSASSCNSSIPVSPPGPARMSHTASRNMRGPTSLRQSTRSGVSCGGS